MIDILNLFYDKMVNNVDLMRLVDVDNIKFNDYPDVQDINKPYIVLDDFDDPVPEVYIDGERYAYNYIVQVDVFVKYSDEYNARLRRNQISQLISDLLWDELKASQVTNLGNEYNKEFSLYRSTRRYEAIFYKEEN